MRRIGVLHDYAEADPEGRVQVVAFRAELEKLGWIEGRNVRIDYRSGAADADALRTYAAEMIALAPDLVLAAGGTVVAALQRASRSVPIVFVTVTDPVGGGLVASLARPGGNTTGFTQFEFASARNGWSCSKNSRRGSRGRRSFAIPPRAAAADSWAQSRRSRPRSE